MTRIEPLETPPPTKKKPTHKTKQKTTHKQNKTKKTNVLSAFVKRLHDKIPDNSYRNVVYFQTHQRVGYEI